MDEEAGGAPIEESMLAQDTVAAQEQGAGYTGYEQQSVGSSGVHYTRQRPPLQQQQQLRPQQPAQLIQVGG
jgi:hypothetical protein